MHRFTHWLATLYRFRAINRMMHETQHGMVLYGLRNTRNWPNPRQKSDSEPPVRLAVGPGLETSPWTGARGP